MLYGVTVLLLICKKLEKRFIMLVKSTQTLTKEETVNAIKKIRDMMGKEHAGELAYSGYYNGYFDWIISFYADDIIHAKKILRDWKVSFENFIDEIYLVEELMTTHEYKKPNPEFEQDMGKIL
jgi:hypothetical protein